MFDDNYRHYSKMWESPFRFYHGKNHLDAMLSQIDKDNVRLLYFALFHDIVYFPGASDNEERSANFFIEQKDRFDELTNEDVDAIVKMILATKNPFGAYSASVAEAVRLDTAILYSSMKDLMEYERLIFKEYQKFSVEEYRRGRLFFLNRCKANGAIGCGTLAEIVASREYNIGIYAGSFNPFHIGHLDILRKAERIFDKVILVQAANPMKGSNSYSLPKTLPNEKIEHSGLIIDLFSKNDKNKYTLIRGLRSTVDVPDEMNYQSWVTEIKPGIEFVHIFGDRCNEKLSSSVIRSMADIEGFDVGKYIVR